MDSLAKSQFTIFLRLMAQVDCHAGWGSVEVRTLANRRDCLRAIRSAYSNQIYRRKVDNSEL